MKNLTIIPIIIFLFLLVSNVLFANDKYTETMQKNIQLVYNAEKVEELQAIANTFNRIAESEKTKWEPFYYEAFAYVMIANRETDGKKKDGGLDLAQKALDKAKSIQQNESEIVAMEGFIHMLRVTVDPASRGQQFSGMAFQSFNKAVGMNPENPRALSLLAQMEYGTAQFFGSATTEACATAAKAIEKFETYKSENPLAPRWGKGMTQGLKSKCK
jgi:hypothetical protein